MDSRKGIEKLQARKNQNNGCFLYNLMLYFLSGFVCSLICYFPFWYCSLSKYSFFFPADHPCSENTCQVSARPQNYPITCSMQQFLYVPYIWSSFSSPRFLFIIANVIIVFLVGESNFVGSSRNSSSSSPAAEFYDEYVERSRRLRNRGAGAASNFPKKIEHKKSHPHHGQLKVIEQSVKRVRQVKDVIKETEKKIGEEEEEAGLPSEELNKRADEFIARVNKQRWLEARSLICCKA